jgi:uncharacterized membrane protein
LDDLMDELWIGIRWLHLLAMAFFVGGQLFLAVAVVPVERRSPDRERLRAIARRFGYATLIAIAVLLVTGSMMAGHFDAWGDPKLHVKLALVALVGVLVVWHMRRPTMHVLEAATFLVSLAIVWLGVSIAHS